MVKYLYKRLMKVWINETNILEERVLLVNHKDKDQVAGLELADSLILCRHQAYKTNKKACLSMTMTVLRWQKESSQTWGVMWT